MKTFTLALALIFTSITANQAMATEYQVYVTHSTHISAAQSDLGSLVQKDIIIDTEAKTVALRLSPICAAQARCPEFIRILSLPLTQIESKNGSVSSITAVSAQTVNNVATTNTVQITLNPNNAMDIVITDKTGTVSTESTFLGSPATLVSAAQ